MQEELRRLCQVLEKRPKDFHLSACCADTVATLSPSADPAALLPTDFRSKLSVDA